MSSNSSGNSDPIEAVATSYFKWLQNTVFPVFVGITVVLVVLVGLILNSILLHAIRKKRLKISFGQIYLINLIILDLVGYAFVLLPSAIVSFAKEWILSDFFCIVSGDFETACFLMTFYLHMLIFIERWMKLTDSELHEHTLGKTKITVIIFIVMWILVCIVGLFPFSGWSVLEYISYQHLCNINHSYNKVGMNLLFAFGFYIPATVSFIFLILISIKRKEILSLMSDLQAKVNQINTKMEKASMQHIINNHKDNNTTYKPNRNEENDVISVSHINSLNCENLQDIEVLSSEIIQNNQIPGSITSRSEANFRDQLFSVTPIPMKNRCSRTTVTEIIYDKSEEQMDIHLTMTYAIMLGAISVLWIPYIILCYIDVYDVISIWGGWYSIVLPITHITFCVKPIIYLSHNKIFRDAAYQTIPESVRTKTEKARKVLQRTMNKVDDFIFLHASDSSSIIDTAKKDANENEMVTFSRLKKINPKQKIEKRSDILVV